MLCKSENSFSAAQRIPRSEGYEHCFKYFVIQDKFFKIFIANNQINNARLGIVLKKKYIPKSVARNRIKRNLREKFRINSIKNLSIDIVIIVKNFDSKSFSNEHLNSLNELFSRVKSRCVKS